VKIFGKIGLFGLAAIAVSSAPALATTITFSGSGTGVSGASLAAQAIFEFADDTLTVTLINVATGDNTTPLPGQDVPGNTLTGVFFDLTGNPILSPVSATIGEELIVQGNLCSIGPCGTSQTNVGGEFRYDTGVFPGGADQGIASAGYIGGVGNFGGPNLDGPPSGAVNGINFGIISDDPNFDPNGGLAVPLILHQVVFMLTGVDGLSADDVSNVSFQYGTSLTEPIITGDCVDCTQDTPEPTTLLLLGCGLAALGLYRRRPRA
jgi:hypothetical protein